ncbi:MAG TPA: type II toxin-antitoxin system Phd/YefM family antitoxin [Parachlamydiaceae bacterium]|nr:type II toxin-antitoxin system Phd/YefM family antitoxin [Parachlamydiaceae bacterium]
MAHWQMQEAKQHFSEVVRMAWKEGPQEITFRGEENAWILSAEDYRKLKREKGNIVDFFQKSPHRDVDLELDRRKDFPRDVKL